MWAMCGHVSLKLECGGFVNVDISGNISGQWIISLSFQTLSASIMRFMKKVSLDFSRDWAFQILPRFHCLATETKVIYVRTCIKLILFGT